VAHIHAVSSYQQLGGTAASILYPVLYSYEAWVVTLKKEYE
jgi:hypothetical protein